MALSTTPVAGTLARGRGLAWWPVVESALVLAAIASILPWFDALSTHDNGRDGRFATAAIAARLPPTFVLPELCATRGAIAQNLVRERLCGHKSRAAANAPPDRLPTELNQAKTRLTRAFLDPLHEARVRLAEVRARAHDGTAEMSPQAPRITQLAAQIEAFVDRYAIPAFETSGPRPLACAFERIQDALSAGGEESEAKANAVMLLGASLDGHRAVPALLRSAVLPSTQNSPTRCPGLREALAALHRVIADARAASIDATKNDAMRALLRTAGWQWAGWSLTGWVLLVLSRRGGPVAPRLALALVAWAGAAWIARVPWPFVSGSEIVFAHEDVPIAIAVPSGFVMGLLAFAVALLAISPWLRTVLISTAQKPASVFGYPGLVAAVGIGWVIVLDLSANAHAANRYLALYHQGHLWLAMLVFSVIAILRQPLSRALAWSLSLVDGVAGNAARHLGRFGSTAFLLAIALALSAVVGTLLLNMRQVTSEIGRLWLVVGAAWFFFLRGMPLAERLARTGNSIRSLVRYVSPLLFVVVVLIGAMLMTRDMGPLLIAGYGAGAFVAASVAMWWYQRRGGKVVAYGFAAILFVAWLVAMTIGLLRLGSLDDVTAARLENAAAPLASANDHLALVTWFQRAAPTWGFRPGGVPWCGFGAASTCAGVPAQIQSDYTFTAVTGMFGWTAAWALTLGCALWLNAIVRGHARATRGEPRLVRVAGRMTNDEQAFGSWVVVAWTVVTLCQLAVTVAGNLAVIPLTGVTFPFVSFGMTSLVANAALLALAVNVNAAGDLHDG